MAATRAVLNTGQSCIAAKRFIVDERGRRRVRAPLRRRRSRRSTVGDPLDDGHRASARSPAPTCATPSTRQVERVGRRRARGCSPAATALDRPGLLLRADRARRRRRPACRRSTRRPSARSPRSSARRDEDDAVELANDTAFGLGASVWTTRPRARRARRAPDRGRRACSSTAWSPPTRACPFGGIKRSGYGRELAAVGIREFVNVQTFWIGATPTVESEQHTE